MEELMDSIVRYGRGNLVAKFKEFGIWDTVCEQLLQSNILFCSSKERPNPMIRQELRSLHYGDDLHTLNKKDTDTLAVEKIQEKDSQMQVISKQVN